MAKANDLLLDALSAAVAAVATHLIVERFDLARRARQAVPDETPRGLKRFITTSALTHSAVAMLSYRLTAGGSRRLLTKLI